MLQPFDAPVTGPDVFRHQIQQAAPPSEAKATEFMRTFLQARVDGEGAEQYMNGDLLYTSANGDPYERFELELVRGPAWPSGWMEFKVRLSAEGGTTAVERLLVDRGEDGRFVVTRDSYWDGETGYS